MEQVTFRLPSQQRERIDKHVEAGGYASRSEFVREAVRERLTDGE